MNFQEIKKEEIVNLHFNTKDVLLNNEHIKDRNQKLINASILGNIEKGKCKIFFQAKEGYNYVETTIWAVTDKYVCLKGGVTLLVTSIFDVIL